ncbi:MAG TPA: 50S ribosomal protein L21 [bacterium]|nr:50S ribosomal protein L21 [bacterium]
MPKFAIVATGGKQYKVRPGQTLKVELLPLEVNAEAQLEALLLADDEAKDVQVGRPALTENIKAKVLEHGKGDKVTVVKYKNKTRYKRVLGHRQRYTKIEVQNW